MAHDFSRLSIVERAGGAEFGIKVVPGASRSAIAGVLGELLKIAVVAPPEGGKANAVVRRVLADLLCAAPAAVEILSGHAQSRKRVRIVGLSAAQIRARLQAG